MLEVRAQLCAEVLCSTSVALSPDLEDCDYRLPIRIHFNPRIGYFVQLRHFMQDNSVYEHNISVPDVLLHTQFSDGVGPQVLPTLVTPLPLCFCYFTPTVSS